MDYQEICIQTIAVAKKAGEFIRKESEQFNLNAIEFKGENDFVSYVDKNAEKLIVEQLSALLPEAGFITEENTIDKKGEVYRWIIDPLDGTTNFIHGLYPYAVSIALQENEKTIVGVVYEVGMNECFYAWKNGGAFVNDKPIKVSRIKKVKQSLVATGFPYKNFAGLPQFMQTLIFLMESSHGVRRLGSAATDLAYVACGRVDAFYEYGLSPWDVAAGTLILEEAGGLICDFRGEDNYIFGKELIATNASIFAEFSRNIIDIMSLTWKQEKENKKLELRIGKEEDKNLVIKTRKQEAESEKRDTRDGKPLERKLTLKKKNQETDKRVDRKKETGSRKNETGDRKRVYGKPEDRNKESGNGKREAGNRKKETGDKKRATGKPEDRKRDSGNRKKETGDKKRTTGTGKRETFEKKRATGSGKKSTGSRKVGSEKPKIKRSKGK